MLVVAMVLLGAVAATPGAAYAAERSTAARITSVTGVVDSARGVEVTVAGKTYDLKEARFQDGLGVLLETPVDLRQKTVVLLFRNGKIDTVTVYRTLPQ